MIKAVIDYRITVELSKNPEAPVMIRLKDRSIAYKADLYQVEKLGYEKLIGKNASGQIKEFTLTQKESSALKEYDSEMQSWWIRHKESDYEGFNNHIVDLTRKGIGYGMGDLSRLSKIYNTEVPAIHEGGIVWGVIPE